MRIPWPRGRKHRELDQELVRGVRVKVVTKAGVLMDTTSDLLAMMAMYGGTGQVQLGVLAVQDDEGHPRVMISQHVRHADVWVTITPCDPAAMPPVRSER